MKQVPNPSFPTPDANALDHSNRLVTIIKKEIQKNEGMISFRRFMELALYAPGLGYYSSGAHKIGDIGDFTTAPQISPLFSRCVARQCEQVLNECESRVILEIGAGTGLMAAHLLRELHKRKTLPSQYLILETSADLRQRQTRTFALEIPDLQSIINWIDVWPQSGFQGCIVANEVLDALPVHRFTIENNKILELNVCIQNDNLQNCTAAPNNNILSELVRELDLAEGYTSEINLVAHAWIQSIAEFIEKGAILLIDYGYPQAEYYHPQRSTGTLMCHYRHHNHGDPFLYPGLQDITAHVDFSAIAKSAHAAHLTLGGYTTQAHFLMSTGLQEFLSDFESYDSKSQLHLAQEVKKLTLPNQMGEIFKVLALTRGIKAKLQGFTEWDMSYRL